MGIWAYFVLILGNLGLIGVLSCGIGVFGWSSELFWVLSCGIGWFCELFWGFRVF